MTALETFNNGAYSFREFSLDELPQITEFINKNYGKSSERMVMHYSQEYVLKSILIDESLPADIKALQPKLCLGIINHENNSIEAIVIGRPTRVYLGGKIIVIVVVSLLCTIKTKRHLLLGPKLIQEFQGKLNEANLLDYTLFAGTHLPFPRIQVATERMIFVCSDTQYYNNWYLKAKTAFMKSGLQTEKLNAHNAKKAIQLLSLFNLNRECYQVFYSENYFFNQFKNTESTFSYIGANEVGEAVLFFSIDKLNYYSEDQHKNIEVANISMFAFSKITNQQFIEIVVMKALDLNFDLIVFPHECSIPDEIATELHILKGSEQWIYSCSAEIFKGISQFNVHFF